MSSAAASSSPDHVPLPAFSQGCKVFIQGLVSKPELNGCRGKVVGCFNADTQRWPVSVTHKAGAVQELSLKEANLVLSEQGIAVATEAKAAAETSDEAETAEATCIYLRGASMMAWSVNGVYDITADIADGYPVYARRGGDGIIIEHKNGKWGVKHLLEMGSDACIAKVEGGRALSACRKRPWYIGDHTTRDFVKQDNVEMLIGDDAHREVSALGHACCAALSALDHATMF